LLLNIPQLLALKKSFKLCLTPQEVPLFVTHVAEIERVDDYTVLLRCAKEFPTQELSRLKQAGSILRS